MNLVQWLQKLAAAVSCEPTQATVDVYLEEFARWHLFPDQWDELLRRAVLRHRFSGRLPPLSELYDIYGEIREERRAQESAFRALRKPEDAVPCPPEIKAQIKEFTRRKS